MHGLLLHSFISAKLIIMLWYPWNRRFDGRVQACTHNRVAYNDTCPILFALCYDSKVQIYNYTYNSVRYLQMWASYEKAKLQSVIYIYIYIYSVCVCLCVFVCMCMLYGCILRAVCNADKSTLQENVLGGHTANN